MSNIVLCSALRCVAWCICSMYALFHSIDRFLFLQLLQMIIIRIVAMQINPSDQQRANASGSSVFASAVASLGYRRTRPGDLTLPTNFLLVQAAETSGESTRLKSNTCYA